VIAGFEEGKEATEHADNYVFATVFFAVVLFFAGISLRFQWFPDARADPRARRGCDAVCTGGFRLLDLPTH